MCAFRRRFRTVLFLALGLMSASSGNSQPFGDGYYRLTTKWLGAEKSLDVINDGTNSNVRLAATQETVGQRWKFTPVGDGYFRITSEWLGDDRALEVAGDAKRDKVRLGAKANISGQLWKIEALGGGYYRLTTKWLGTELSLDIVNDSKQNVLTMAETSKVDGQFWKITSLSTKPLTTSIRPLKDFKRHSILGFTVNVHPELADRPEMVETLERVKEDLNLMIGVLKPSQLEQLKKVPIWVQYKLVTDGLLWYHTSTDWLASKNYPLELENSIEISNVGAFLALEKGQPYGLLHEYAHAFQDLYIPDLQEKLQDAFKQAVSSKKYENVAHENGSTMRAYAITDITEYFAELTEAYFDMNDYYPFKRKELAEFDPVGFRLMQEAWGK